MGVLQNIGGNKTQLIPTGHSMIAPNGEVRPLAPSSTFEIFPIIDYDPGNPPEDLNNLRQWVDEELNRLSAILRNQFFDKAGFILYGGADSFTLGTTPQPIVNYEFSGFYNGGQPSRVDPVAGTIEIPNQGLYEITALVTGNQGTGRQNETLALSVVVDGNAAAIDVRDTNSSQTSARAFNGSIIRGFNGGEIVNLELEATRDLGTFTVVSTTFEIERVGDLR